MEIRRILVNFELDRFSPALASCASALAQRFSAEVIGFSAAVPSPAFAGVHGAVAAASVYAEQRIEIETQLGAGREKFVQAMPAAIKSEWRQMVETPNRGLVEIGRAVDLVLAGSPDASPWNPLRSLNVGDALLSLGRPMLLVSPGTQEIKADRIVIGWKDTKEARRAVVDALPFLKSASAVKLCAIEEGDFAHAKPSVEDVLHWLQRHDVNATSDIVPKEYEGLSATLDKARRDFGADLVVTGAYGHSRLQEWFLGGMTRDLLETPISNRFMSN